MPKQMPTRVLIPVTTSSPHKPDWIWGSLFHGAIIDLLPKAEANEFHISQLHPWSQYLSADQCGNVHWVVSLLTSEMETLFDQYLFSKLPMSIYLRQKNLRVELDTPSLRIEKTFDSIYRCSEPATGGCGSMTMSFLTPTSFKQRGKEIKTPDIGLIYNSMASQWNAFKDPEVAMMDLSAEKRASVCSAVKILNDETREEAFSVNGSDVPGFVGKLRFRCDHEDICRDLKRLVSFATFSGIGRKTSLGMGGVAAGIFL